MSKKIDFRSPEPTIGVDYPSPFDEPCLLREKIRLGDAAGLTQFGVNLLCLLAGSWSSQRHWQTASDEFVYVLSGEVTLVTDEGPEILRAGDAAGFKANDADGHCLQNRFDCEAFVLEVGTRISSNAAHHSDIDMYAPPKPATYRRRDGMPFQPRGGPEAKAVTS